MIGDKIGEEAGKVIGMRVLPGEGGRYVKMEVTIQTEATYLGHKGTDTGWNFPRIMRSRSTWIVGTHVGMDVWFENEAPRTRRQSAFELPPPSKITARAGRTAHSAIPAASASAQVPPRIGGVLAQAMLPPSTKFQ